MALLQLAIVVVSMCFVLTLKNNVSLGLQPLRLLKRAMHLLIAAAAAAGEEKELGPV